ncbi:DUF397 domain-containing protein [Nocardiopsis lambiniae]|uniref:DUF397 domain-containing protein n=1 Tax=Nocardiopsis lambiniae TaxID=3075539 RepID=A0ABU2MDJ9_9ACTN|nr:DUF397 domain-containing protein [Nocardiopsis sp. DSM 44743]MDT0330758.1 DUF397 domain-containing protein [Nocardiopsis sp. DSM 44743]
MNSNIPNEAFRKSSYSHPQSQNCVEVADLPGGSAIRDTQNREAGHLMFAQAEWAGLISSVRRDG